MQITLKIPAERIASLFSSAIEGNDPVTTNAKGGWCNGINWKARRKPLGKWWYAEAENFAGNKFLIEIVEVDDEETGHETKHVIHSAHVRKGLAIMAEKYGHLFAQILKDDIDAPCADIFLQCVLFGEEKYA